MPLRLYTRADSPYLWLRGSIGGVRVRESTGETERRHAEAVLERRTAELRERREHGEGATATFARAVNAYLDEGGEARYLAPLLGHFGPWRLADITQRDLDSYARAALPDASPGHVNRAIYTPFSAVWAAGARAGLCDDRRWRRPKGHHRPRDPGRLVTPAEIEACLDASREASVRRFVILAVGTGLREADVLASLAWERTDLRHGEARVWIEKQDRWGVVPLQPRVVAELALTPPDARRGPLLLNRRGRPYALNPNGGGVMRDTLHRLAARAGVAPFSSHDLRRSFATWSYAVHGSELRVMRDGLWESDATVRRYIREASPGLAAEALAHGWTMDRAKHESGTQPVRAVLSGGKS